MRQLKFNWKAFGRLVKQYRYEHKLSLRKFPYDKTAVWRIEHGKAIKAPTLIALAKKLKIKTLDKFLVYPK